MENIYIFLLNIEICGVLYVIVFLNDLKLGMGKKINI